MKHCMIKLSLLACASTGLVAKHENRGRESTPLSKAGTIKRSGEYFLKKDICGTITIAADEVTLNLNNHKVDAKGAPYAINAQGRTGVTIMNGSVVHSKNAGINIIACEEVEVSGITFRDHADISLSIQAESVGPCPLFEVTRPSQGIWVSNCDISNGNRAMLLRGCDELTIESTYVHDNVNTIPHAVVGIEHCNDVLVYKLCADSNMKQVPHQGQTQPLTTLGFETAVVLIQASNNVHIQNSTTQTNLSLLSMNPLLCIGADFDFTNPEAPGIITGLSKGLVIEGHQSDGNMNSMGTSTGINVSFIDNPIIRDSQTNGNITTEASNGTTFGTQDFLVGLLVLSGKGAYIKNHLSNHNASKNIVTGNGSETFGILVAAGTTSLADGAILEDCMTNDNGDFEQSSIAFGINLSIGSVAASSHGALVRRCQSNGNTAHHGAGGFVLSWNDIRAEDCQADNNRSTGAPDPANNIAQNFTAGFTTFTDVSNIRLLRCTASHNSCIHNPAVGINASGNILGNADLPPGNADLPPSYVVVQECVTNGSSSTHNIGYGVRLYGAKSSQVLDSTAVGNAVGFFNTLGGPHNSFFGNTAENNITLVGGNPVVTNYQNIPDGSGDNPTGNTVTFFKSTATFSTMPNRWTNLNIVD